LPRLDELLRLELLDFRAVVLRAPELDLGLPLPDFAEEREDEEPLLFFAPEEREPVLPLDLRDEPLLELREEPEELRPPPPLLVEELLELPSIDHLPDMTRCAASATASAMSEPSLVALDIIDLPAFSAVSAASIPASLIALRALGLAAIAAAAAVSPAASISLLIAALAIFSLVDRDDPEEPDEDLVDFEDFELLRVLDFAIEYLPSGRRIRQTTAATVPLRRRKGKAILQIQRR
jgi:hypothetical protein